MNTATPPVLLSLDENLTAADVERLLTEREGSGFSDIPTLFAPLVPPDVLNNLGDSTEFFRLKVVVRIDTVRITLYSLLQRAPTGTVSPILRSLGTA